VADVWVITMTININQKLLPPVYFQICFLLEIVLYFFLPAGKIISLFKKRKTTVKPFEKPYILITNGPFLVSRHPMYLGFVLILFGLAVFLGSLAVFLPTIVMFFTLEKLFIPYEEKNLENKFGKEYKEYKELVRRWL